MATRMSGQVDKKINGQLDGRADPWSHCGIVMLFSDVEGNTRLFLDSYL